MNHPLSKWEANPQKYYHELNDIYAKIGLNDITILDNYSIYYLMKFSNLSDYIINTHLSDM